MTILTITVLISMAWVFALAYYLRLIMMPSPNAKR